MINRKYKLMMDNPKIHNFIERNLVKEKSIVSERVFVELKCPCCDYQCGEYHNNLYVGFLLHLISKIRLTGDIPHMRLMISLFGIEYSTKLFKKWAKQSKIVYKNLKKVVVESEDFK